MVLDFNNIPDDPNERTKMTATAWVEYYRLEEMTQNTIFDPTKAVPMHTILQDAAKCVWHQTRTLAFANLGDLPLIIRKSTHLGTLHRLHETASRSAFFAEREKTAVVCSVGGTAG